MGYLHTKQRHTWPLPRLVMSQLAVIVVAARVHLAVTRQQQRVALATSRFNHILRSEPIQTPGSQDLLLLDSPQPQLPVHRAAPRVHHVLSLSSHVVTAATITIRGNDNRNFLERMTARNLGGFVVGWKECRL